MQCFAILLWPFSVPGLWFALGQITAHWHRQTLHYTGARNPIGGGEQLDLLKYEACQPCEQVSRASSPDL
jgi:hypothetical protein